MISVDSLRNIIRISLSAPFYSPQAEELLLMICAHESNMGRHTRQIGGGPARGICQVEILTMVDNYDNFITPRKRLAKQIEAVTGVSGPSVGHLEYNPLYNCFHARLKLWRSPGKLPNTIPEMAHYAKQYYNTPGGAATVKDYIDAYNRHVLQLN